MPLGFGRPMNCVACGHYTSSSRFQSLLERPYPDNLKTVLSCAGCNSGFSFDKQYFLVLLAQISTSPTLISEVENHGSIYQALERSPALDKRIMVGNQR